MNMVVVVDAKVDLDPMDLAGEALLRVLACPGSAHCVVALVQNALKPSKMPPFQARICALPGAFLVSRLQTGPTQPCFRDENVPLHRESCNLWSLAAADLPFSLPNVRHQPRRMAAQPDYLSEWLSSRRVLLSRRLSTALDGSRRLSTALDGSDRAAGFILTADGAAGLCPHGRPRRPRPARLWRPGTARTNRSGQRRPERDGVPRLNPAPSDREAAVVFLAVTTLATAATPPARAMWSIVATWPLAGRRVSRARVPPAATGLPLTGRANRRRANSLWGEERTRPAMPLSGHRLELSVRPLRDREIDGGSCRRADEYDHDGEGRQGEAGAGCEGQVHPVH